MTTRTPFEQLTDLIADLKNVPHYVEQVFLNSSMIAKEWLFLTPEKERLARVIFSANGHTLEVNRAKRKK